MVVSSYRSSRRPTSATVLPSANVPDALEPRTLFAAPPPSTALQTEPTVQVVIDYSLDTNNFFDTPLKRDLLQQAADSVVKWMSDELLSITPSGTDTWDAVLDHPGTGLDHTLVNPTVGANQVLLFAGGRDMSDALGRGGPGGFQARGTAAWRDRVARRGQPSTGGPEFGPWGGAITFDTSPANPWHFGQSTAGLSGSNDFLSVASHEVAHLLGFGTSDAWNGRVNSTTSTFVGPNSVALYDGTGNVPLHDDDSHWANGTRDEGREVAMDPLITVGARHLLTPLDYAGLDDIGWSLPPRAAPSLPSVTQPGAVGHEVVVTYSHYGKPDPDSFQQAGDVFAVGPGAVQIPANYSRMALGTDGTVVDVTYVLAPPGGAWDAADNGIWSLVLSPNAVLSTTGEAVAGGTLGTFVIDVADAPVGALQPLPEPAAGSPTHTLVVVYTDAVAVDPSSVDASDLMVTGPNNLPVVVTAASVDAATPGSPRIATYAIAAPGGTWGPEDDGVYTVNVREGQVTDTSGNGSAAAPAGTFEIGLGALPFDARTPVTFTDASGDVVRVTLKGPGAGRVRFAAARPADAVEIELEGTTAASALNVKTGPAGTPVGAVTVNGSLKSLAGKTLDLLGNLTASGTLGLLRLRSSAPGGAVSAASIGSIVAGAWAADVVSASLLNKVKVASLAGDILAAGGIGTVSAPTITGSRIFAGVLPNLNGLPASFADFVNPAATIRGVTTKSFANSFVAAPTIGKLALGLAPTGGGAADRYTTLTGRVSLAERPFKFRNLDAPSSGPILPNLQVLVF